MTEQNINPHDLLSQLQVSSKPSANPEFAHILEALQNTPYAPRNEQELLMDYWMYRMFVKPPESVQRLARSHNVSTINDECMKLHSTPLGLPNAFKTLYDETKKDKGETD